jgi:hypothetical protein
MPKINLRQINVELESIGMDHHQTLRESEILNGAIAKS